MESNMQQLLTDSITGLRALADALELIRDTNDEGAKVVQPELFAGDGGIENEEEIPALSLVDVRRILAEKSRDGHTEQVRALLIKYGADKLSEINPKNYASLVKEAECLGATAEDIKEVLKHLDGRGLEDEIKAVFDHHYATGLDDLKAEYRASFLRDIKELARE